ncbi:MAG: hypothetical protein IPL55_10040 [Saprospiraceae bacterium]|nr:hypothetical protein [Saprospiraceae bacterium]
MKVEVLNTEIKTQEQGMLQGFNDSKDVVKDIHDRLTILQEKSKTFSGRIMMSGKDKALLQRQNEHDLKLISIANKATETQTEAILETRSRACVEACNSMLLTIVTSLKALSAAQAQTTIGGCISNMVLTLEKGLQDVDKQFQRADLFIHPTVKNAAYKQAELALKSIEDTFEELLAYVKCNNLLMPV